MTGKSLLFAMGGNSLIKDSEHLQVEDQYAAICSTVEKIGDIIEAGNRAVITHGNGPQVGFILRRSEIASEVAQMHSVPLVSCDADTQGAIGYQIQQALDNEFRKREIQKNAVTLVTQIRVDPDDKAFDEPAKPIGRFYLEDEYQLLKEVHPEWSLKEDAGRGYRRVVASPLPHDIIEIEAIRYLYENDFTIIAAGGGGIPVVQKGNRLEGVDAVIDKDMASALLASELGIEILVISTGVSHVYLNFKTSDEKKLEQVSVKDIKNHLDQGHFAPGSMKPKIEAALFFLEHGGKEVIITHPGGLGESVFKGKGTHIIQG